MFCKPTEVQVQGTPEGSQPRDVIVVEHLGVVGGVFLAVDVHSFAATVDMI